MVERITSERETETVERQQKFRTNQVETEKQILKRINGIALGAWVLAACVVLCCVMLRCDLL